MRVPVNCGLCSVPNSFKNSCHLYSFNIFLQECSYVQVYDCAAIGHKEGHYKPR